MIKFRSSYVTTADRARMAARQAEHVETYGATRPVFILPFTVRQFADVVSAVFMVLFVAALVAGYAADASAAADMCAEVFSNPGTDHIPAVCAEVSTR